MEDGEPILGRLLKPEGDLKLVSELVSTPVLREVESAVGLCIILLKELSRVSLSIPILGIRRRNSLMLGLGSNILCVLWVLLL